MTRVTATICSRISVTARNAVYSRSVGEYGAIDSGDRGSRLTTATGFDGATFGDSQRWSTSSVPWQRLTVILALPDRWTQLSG